ncbi:hypothetical protein [Zymomonas sp.]|nr:hypothetical protein [Zymomonas sp.]MCA1955485.1 hypothetical protein [Zymomonas sp.]
MAFLLLPAILPHQKSGDDNMGNPLTAFFFLEMNPVNQTYSAWGKR